MLHAWVPVLYYAKITEVKKIVRAKNILVDGLASQKFQIYIHTAAISPVYSHKMFQFDLWTIVAFLFRWKKKAWRSVLNVYLLKCMKYATTTHTPKQRYIVSMIYEDFLCCCFKKILLDYFFSVVDWGCFFLLLWYSFVILNYFKPEQLPD